MSLLRGILVAAMLLSAIPVWANDSAPIPDEDAKLSQLMGEGYRLVSSGKPQAAMPYFDQVATAYEARHADSKAKIYCARSSTETLKYLLLGASTKTQTVVYTADWAYAYFMKAYALIDLGQIPEARRLLQRALALSPDNSQFLSELGHIHQMEKNWPMALQAFRSAEAAAALSPPAVKNKELARAWRGIGYALVEQHKLDEAEKVYRQCLDLDKNDNAAQAELRYVLDLKARQPGL